MKGDQFCVTKEELGGPQCLPVFLKFSEESKEKVGSGPWGNSASWLVGLVTLDHQDSEETLKAGVCGASTYPEAWEFVK